MSNVAVHTMPVTPFLRVVTPEGEPDWRDLALCAEADPDEWFPEKGGSSRKAKAICAGCPSRLPCLEFALENNEGYGIWGGLSEQQRRRLYPDAPRMCGNGLHEMTPDNTYTYPNGVKTCRACKDASSQRRAPRRHDGKPVRTERAA